MADAAGEYRIKATIDTAGATAGADQLVTEVKKVEGATGDAAATTGKLDEAGSNAARTLGSLRNAHHALLGIMELAQGGQAAVGGLAFEGRVATEVFVGMLGPLAPVLMIITTLTALAIPMIERWEEQRSKIGETKDDTKDLTDATDAYKTKIDAVLESQGQIEQSDKRQLDALKEKQGLANKQVELDKNVEIEKARAEYLRANGEASTDQERKRLLAQFEATKKDIEGGSSVNVAQNVVTFTGEDIEAAKKELADDQDGKAKAQQQLSDAQDAALAGQDYLATQGVGIGPDLLPQKDALKAAMDAADKKITDAQAAKDSASASGVDLSMTPMFDQNIAAATDQRDKLIAAAAAMNAYPEALKTLTKSIQDQSTKIDEDQSKLDNLQTEYAQAKQALITATKNLADDQQQAADDLTEQNRQAALIRARKDRDDAIQAQLNEVEGKLTAPNLPEATRDAFLKQQANLRIDQVRSKITDLASDPEKNSSAGQGLLQSEIDKINSDLASKLGQGQNKDAEQQIADYKQQIDQVGRGLPEGARQVLDDAMRKIEAMDKGNPMKEALDLMNLFIDRQATINAGVQDQLSEAKSKLNRHYSP